MDSETGYGKFGIIYKYFMQWFRRLSEGEVRGVNKTLRDSGVWH